MSCGAPLVHLVHHLVTVFSELAVPSYLEQTQHLNIWFVSLMCSQVTFFLKAKKPKKVDGLHHSNGIGLRSQTITKMIELFIS